MIGAGIDAGSRALKVALFDSERGQVLAAALATPVRVCPEPQMTGALGAALIACRQASASA
jgi:activator of 2-hydroxyglutaryl-CoA dehydratase